MFYVCKYLNSLDYSYIFSCFFPMQFMTLDPGRREMFWRTVNEDAEKLITEIGESTHEMRKLRGELAECNQIFLSLSATAQEEGLYFSK